MSEVAQYFLIIGILGSFCFMAMVGVLGYLAYKLVENTRLSQAALSHNALEMAEIMKSQNLIEKAHHDQIDANTEANIKILHESIDQLREGPEKTEIAPEKITLSSGMELDMSEWSRL